MPARCSDLCFHARTVMVGFDSIGQGILPLCNEPVDACDPWRFINFRVH